MVHELVKRPMTRAVVSEHSAMAMTATVGMTASYVAGGEDARIASAHVVFLTVNDVYKLLPADDGMGGVAPFASLLDAVKARLPASAYPIVTLNGDFLWRTELERPHKAELMIRVLHELGVEYVVLGNHEFDFGAHRCLELLPSMEFKVMGSNVRLCEDRGLLPGVVDFEIVTLPSSGIKLGLFGVLTSNPHEFVHPNDPEVVFESELSHAKRCVRALHAAGADVIVALTHTRLAKDRLIARQVAGIHLILGGHDHEPVTLFEKTTLIHKSGCDALWLAMVDMFITKEAADLHGDEPAEVDVQFGWNMIPNRGYAPKPSVQRLLDEYFENNASQSTAAATMKATLAVTRTWLDATRVTVRSEECRLGNVVADAIRVGMNADIAFINGGFIQGERKYKAGLHLTREWLEEVLPIRNHAQRVTVKAGSLRQALLGYLSNYPDENSSWPHVSGVILDFWVDFSTNKRALRLFRDRDHHNEIQDEDVVRVASSAFMFDEAGGHEHFKDRARVETGPVIRELVASFLQTLPGQELQYPQRDGRVVIREEY